MKADNWIFDYYISYAEPDKPWAEWIAWQIEAAGSRVLVDAWDSMAGQNRLAIIREALKGARRVLILVSPSYLESAYDHSAWQAIYVNDPLGFDNRLVPVKIADCALPDLLAQVSSINLYGLSGEHASERLLGELGALERGRKKPSNPPVFPGHERQQDAPIAILTRHSQGVSGVAISSDGNVLATASWDRTIAIWNPQPSAPVEYVSTVRNISAPISSVAFVGDSLVLASAAVDGQLALHDLVDPARPHEIVRFSCGESLPKFAISPDGTLMIVGTAAGNLHLWDISRPRAPIRHEVTEARIGEIGSVEFGPDSRLIAVGGSSGSVHLRRIHAESRSFFESSWRAGSGIRALSFDPSGEILALGCLDHSLHLLNTAEPRTLVELSLLRSHRRSIEAVLFVPRVRGSLLVTAGTDHQVKVWRIDDPVSPQIEKSLDGHLGAVVDLAYSPRQNILATASLDETVMLWRIRG